MEWILWFIGGGLWYWTGKASFIYWWTRKFDYTSDEELIAMLMGTAGPIAFLIGFIVQIVTSSKPNPQIIKRKKS